MIEVEYELTREDLFHFQKRASTATPVARRMIRRIRVSYVVSILVVAVLMQPWLSWIAFSGFAIFCLVFVVGGFLWHRHTSRQLITEYVDDNTPEKGTLGRHRIVVDDSGLAESTAVGEERVRWPGVYRIDRDSIAFYIYTGPHKAHMIPLRAFSSPDDAERFFAFVHSSIGSPAV